MTKGALFALVALGYTLVYGILELINFAHGDVFMIGGMISATVALEQFRLDGGPPASGRHSGDPRLARGSDGGLRACSTRRSSGSPTGRFGARHVWCP